MGTVYQNQFLHSDDLAASMGLSMEKIPSIKISSCSKKNHCAHLIRHLFTTDEMKTSNVSGKTTGAIAKKALDPTKISVINKNGICSMAT